MENNESGLHLADAVTHFLASDRLGVEKLEVVHERLANHSVLRAVLDASPEPAFVLNGQRQIILVNDKAASLLGKSEASLLGLRPGEALECIHALDMPAGCGTSESCRYCGAAVAIFSCQSRLRPSTKECLLTRWQGGVDESSLELRVWVTCMDVDGERLTIVYVQDISGEKRRELLERIFFHDAMNSAGALQGVSELLIDGDLEDMRELCGNIHVLSRQLVEEIKAQRDLVAAERGELEVHSTTVGLRHVALDVVRGYQHHPLAQHRTILLQGAIDGEVIETDRVLLTRVVGNLVKNALEASDRGQTVTVILECGDHATIRVRNESAMRESVKRQIFKRSFSTKSEKGRGMGTYSIKLLTERYLGGEVSFESDEVEGTTFTIRLP